MHYISVSEINRNPEKQTMIQREERGNMRNLVQSPCFPNLFSVHLYPVLSLSPGPFLFIVIACFVVPELC